MILYLFKVTIQQQPEVEQAHDEMSSKSYSKMIAFSNGKTLGW